MMLTRACLSLALLGALPTWSQVAPAAVGGDTDPDSSTEMRIPPPVSGQAYPTETGDEERANYLRAGFTLEAAYDDNVLPYYISTPIGSMIYTISPTFTIDKVTPRLHETLTFVPGYTLYQNVSARNEASENVSVNFQYRTSPHVAFSVQDSFQRSSNVFSQPYAFSGEPTSGSPPSLPEGAIAPFADVLSNVLNGGLSYQMSARAMIGGSGTMTKLIYPNLSEVPGLYNSNSEAGSVFYNRRLTISQYAGATYQYSKYVASPGATQSKIQTQTMYFFYTIYETHAVSLSFSGGPQYYDASVWPFPAYTSWTPAISASLACQTSRANFTASYSRTVTGGGGLLGAYHSNTALASARWQVSHNWTVAPSADYYIYKTVNSLFLPSSPQGHTISGVFSAERTFGSHLTLALGYERLHLSYAAIAVLAASPDDDRGSVSITYHFERSLGR